MKTTKIQGFSGLTYVTVSNIPIKKSEFGDVIAMEPRELERIVSAALIEEKVPVRGVEFRVFKSAIGLSNEAIAQKLGVSRNTVLKWGKELEKRLPPPYEMLVRLLVSELVGVEISPSIDSLQALDKAKKINIKAA